MLINESIVDIKVELDNLAEAARLTEKAHKSGNKNT